MNKSEIFKAAHMTARTGFNFKEAAKFRAKGWNYETYSDRFARALKYWNARSKGEKMKGKKVVIISCGSVAFVKSAMRECITLVDKTGISVWKCGTRGGNFKPEDIRFV